MPASAGVGPVPNAPGRRGEGYYKINSTVVDDPGVRASLIDRRNLVRGDLHFRGLEAGDGISIDIVDFDEDRFVTVDEKIRISATGAGGPANLLVYDAPVLTNGQTSFAIPLSAVSVHIVTINGLETTNFTFTLGPPTVLLNDVAIGYQVEPSDQVLVFYKA